MKKIVFFVMVVVFLSCSSDDDNNSTKELSQCKVDIFVLKEKRDNYLHNGVRTWNSDVISSNIYRDRGCSGVYVHNDGKDLHAFDRSCPIEKSYNDINLYGRLIMTYDDNKDIITKCEKCGSEFSPVTMNPIFGEAKDRRFKLIEYNITLVDGGHYHITNPNYKGK